jgi:hypothetical protein
MWVQMGRASLRYLGHRHMTSDALSIQLAGAIDAQIGALGEETAAVALEVVSAILVAMGDAGMPRDHHRQELDLLAIVDGSLVAFEVKTRYRSRDAGRLTRNGNLPRPRFQSPRLTSGSRQGSQEYVAQRLGAYVNTDDGYEGIDVRLIAIDFRAMLLQQFEVNDTGTRLAPLGPPTDCTDAAEHALARIIDHRGRLDDSPARRTGHGASNSHG